MSWNVWWTHLVALCCHPNLGSLVGSNDGVLSLKAVQEGTLKPCFNQMFHARSESIKTWGWVSGHPLHHGRGHCGVALVHHGEAISPTCPVSTLSYGPKPPTENGSDAVTLAMSWCGGSLRTRQTATKLPVDLPQLESAGTKTECSSDFRSK